MIRLFLIAFLSQVLSPSLVPVIPPSTPFKISFEASPTDSLRWWCDGEIKRNFVAADLTKGAVSTTNAGFIAYEATVPGLTAGVHSCQVSAWKVIEGSPEVWPDQKSQPPISILVGTGPLTPINLKVVIVISGTVK